jgi:hypothetical protein
MTAAMARSIGIAGAALLTAALLIAATNPAVTRAAADRSCKPVVNPYAGTRYAGINLRRIRALRVSCRTARRVTRQAHRKALGLTPTPSGVRTFTWRRWTVTGDIRGSKDRYVARARGGKRVRWLF